VLGISKITPYPDKNSYHVGLVIEIDVPGIDEARRFLYERDLTKPIE